LHLLVTNLKETTIAYYAAMEVTKIKRFYNFDTRELFERWGAVISTWKHIQG
jgi:hypothetical protein